MSLSDPKIAGAFGAVLRATRRARGLTQEALANACEFDRTYPSLLERGLRTPTLATLLRLAAVLQVEPGQLVTDTLAHLSAPAARDREPHERR